MRVRKAAIEKRDKEVEAILADYSSKYINRRRITPPGLWQARKVTDVGKFQLQPSGG